ncbi:MAG: hypothetical protein IK116_03695 [Firmicutes bacterium]|nr:hypothetical protein [Bacillota bacterium]
MTQFLLVGGICVALYGVFLMIRGMINVYREKEMKMFWSALIFFIVVPLLLLVVILLVKHYNLWTALPVLVLGGAWVVMGYFFESYLRKEKARKADGMKKILPKPKPGQIRKDLILLGAAVLVWILGVTGLFSKNGTIETAAVCICFFLLASSIADLWKYRGF